MLLKPKTPKVWKNASNTETSNAVILKAELTCCPYQGELFRCEMLRLKRCFLEIHVWSRMEMWLLGFRLVFIIKMMSRGKGRSWHRAVRAGTRLCIPPTRSIYWQPYWTYTCKMWTQILTSSAVVFIRSLKNLEVLFFQDQWALKSWKC